MSASSATSVSSSANQTLSQADFLQLLVTQMTSQDPLNPQSDTEFASQLAQFTALQQAQTTQTDMASLQANALIGETVTVQPTNGAPAVTGIVAGVVMSKGQPNVYIDGNIYPLTEITTVAPTIPTSSTTGGSTTGGSTTSSSTTGSSSSTSGS